MKCYTCGKHTASTSCPPRCVAYDQAFARRPKLEDDALCRRCKAKPVNEYGAQCGTCAGLEEAIKKVADQVVKNSSLGRCIVAECTDERWNGSWWCALHMVS